MAKNSIHKNINLNYIMIFKIVVCFLTVLAAYYKVVCGWDQDESYIILLAEKIRSGNILFRDIWDLHQTCAVIPALLLKPYVALFGTAGLGIYLRIVTTVILFATAGFSYFGIKRFYGREAAFFSSVIVLNMLPRATLQLEYGLSTVLFGFVSSLILLEIWKDRDSKSLIRVLMAGFFYALSIFTYPTMIITIPVFLYILLFRINEEKKVRIKYTCFFGGMCFLCFVIFMVYIMNYLSIGDFVSIIGEFGKTADHPQMFPAFHNLKGFIKSSLRIAVMIGAPVIVYILLRKWLLLKSQIIYLYLILCSVLVILVNVTGLRPSGPFGLLERYIGFVILVAFLFFRMDDKPLFWTLFVGGLAYYLGSLMGSALGFNENAMFLEMSIIAGMICIIKKYDQYDVKRLRIIAYIAILFFSLEIIFSKGYFVRINGTKPANITECNSRLEKGPFKGIYVDEHWAEDYYKHIEEIEKSSDPERLFMYLGNDPVYNFFFNGKTTSAQYVGTARPNIQFVDYYGKFKHILPDFIYVDKKMYPNKKEFYEYEFIKYLDKNFVLKEKDIGEEFYIISIVDKHL